MPDDKKRSSEEVLEDYQARGFVGDVGFGDSPAILVVDLILGFTQPDSPLGADLDSVVEATRRLLDAGRGAGVPIVYTTTSYGSDLRDAGLFPRKVPSLAILCHGSEAVQIDPRLGRRDEETLVEKKYVSVLDGFYEGATKQL